MDEYKVSLIGLEYVLFFTLKAFTLHDSLFSV